MYKVIWKNDYIINYYSIINLYYIFKEVALKLGKSYFVIYIIIWNYILIFIVLKLYLSKKYIKDNYNYSIWNS